MNLFAWAFADTHLCLRLQLLLRLQFVHLAQELLEQFATLWADALLQLVHASRRR